MYSGELDHNKTTRGRSGIKEDKVYAKVNHNPSTAAPGDELVIRMPKLNANTVLYPNSLNLTYDFKLDDGASASVADIPDHLVNAIVERFQLNINGMTIHDISNFNHLAMYKDFFMLESDYEKNMAHRGIDAALTKSKRHSLNGAADDVLGSIHKQRYVFKLSSFLTDVAFNPQSIDNNIEFKIKLMAGKYKLGNICLEYQYVQSSSLSYDIKQKYINHRHIINDYKSHTTTAVKKEESEFEINVNAVYESLRAIVILFKEDNTPNLKYNYPNIKNLRVDIDGTTNQIYSSDYLPQYAYDDVIRYFGVSGSENGTIKLNQKTFYDDKYALVIDLRTIDDEGSSGTGREIKDNIKIKISKNETNDDYKAFTYLIYDKAVQFTNNMINSILS